MEAGNTDLLIRLCEQASKEQDHDKLVQLAREVARLLDEEEKEVTEKRQRAA